MKFGSVCSGIEAASVAWHPLGWQAAWFAEIEPFPAAVLAHHYPNVANHGDMTRLPAMIRSGEVEAPEVFCGGTPCQAFSVAGLRNSLDDERGALSLTFVEIANAIDDVRRAAGKPAGIIFWENVPGVLSTKDNAFGCFLAALAGCDSAIVPNGRWPNAGMVAGPSRAVAWRLLDAKYFGLAQRRKRVFVVASAREGFDPAAVLFEREGVRRDSAPSREARKVAPIIPSRSTAGGGLGTDFDCDGGVIAQPYAVGNTLTERMHKGINSTLDEGQTPVLAFHHTQDPISSENVCHSISSGNGQGCATAAVAFTQNQRNEVRVLDVAGALAAEPGMKQQTYLAQPIDENATAAVAYNISPGKGALKDDIHVTGADSTKTLDASASNPAMHQGGTAILQSMAVRRLTPVECERLQGFPDNYTAIPWRKKPASECPDGPRYKALGNSWAVPVVRWIGHRIAHEVAKSSR